MNAFWLEIFIQAVEEKGAAQVARELGVSTTTISLVKSGQYGASTKNIEQKVINIYGSTGLVECPALGNIEPSRCIDNWELAKKIGMSCGNPATMRLYKACLQCTLRNS